MAGSRAVSIRDIAREAGVSPTTVSAALRGDAASASIGDDTRERVIAVAERMGYDHSRLRRAEPAPRYVVTLWPGGNHPVEPVRYGMVFQLAARLAHNGYLMLVDGMAGGAESPQSVPGGFANGAVRGVIVVECQMRIADMATWPIPSVYIGTVPDGLVITHVCVDDELGGRLAAEHLLALGHRELAIVRPRAEDWALRRETGVRAALAANHLSLPPERVMTVGKSLERLTDRTLAAFLEGPGAGVTGLVCDSDWVASHVVRALRAIGVRVPDDVSVTGYDDAHYADLLDPPLTTIRQRFVEMGALAATLLLQQIRTGERTTERMMVPPELVVRGSTAPVRG